MKNIEMIWATAFTSPKTTKSMASAQVIREALKGSLSFFRKRLSHLLMRGRGKLLSLASACSVLGATMTDPSAEEMVEAASPSGITMAPYRAILPITN